MTLLCLSEQTMMPEYPSQLQPNHKMANNNATKSAAPPWQTFGALSISSE